MKKRGRMDRRGEEKLEGKEGRKDLASLNNEHYPVNPVYVYKLLG